jgi:aspartate ammonia-lyase
VNQVAFTVIGNDLAVTMAAEGGQLQLNAFEPIIARSLMMSIIYLRRSCRVLREFCIDGITANEEFLRSTVENSIGLVTALAPKLGYESASAIAKHAQMYNKTVRESALELGLMTHQEFEEALGDVDKLTGQG